jgi:transcriptional regulator with XRE-family HTH domain
MTRPVRTAVKRPGAGVTIDRERLVRMREIRLLSRAQLAAKMSAEDDEFSITPDAIAKIENGYRRPKIVTLDRICEALGCQPEELLPAAQPALPASSRRTACKNCGGIYAHDSGCPDAT